WAERMSTVAMCGRYFITLQVVSGSSVGQDGRFVQFNPGIDIFRRVFVILSVSLTEYILLAMSSLFVIVDPLATAPAFLAMTPNDSSDQRLRTARLACLTLAIVLLGFAFAGTMIFRVFGITMPAFEIAASIVLLIIALDMLRVQRSR